MSISEILTEPLKYMMHKVRIVQAFKLLMFLSENIGG